MSDTERMIMAAGLAALYGLFCLWILWRRPQLVADAGQGEILVAYASQAGTARAIATQSAEALAGQARLLPLNQVDDRSLARARRLLIVASTYGDGEPPDNGVRFARHVVTGAGDRAFSGLEFAVLALGDSRYPAFCRFGRDIHRSLRDRGARPLCDPIELDASRADATGAAVDRWRDQLRRLHVDAVFNDPPDANNSHFQSWDLAKKVLLNPGSPGDPLYHLTFVATDNMPGIWQAGDIVEVIPHNRGEDIRHFVAQLGLDPGLPVTVAGEPVALDDLLCRRQLPGDPVAFKSGAGDDLPAALAALAQIRPRQYSIASVAMDGTLELVVRQQCNGDGSRGLASGWLTDGLAMGDSVRFRFCPNPGFRTPDQAAPLILIGNGSGFAGLRAHLKHRQYQGGGQNWLLFGERDPVSDRVFDAEIRYWLRDGTLAELDLAFSRCPQRPRYVQDCLCDRAQTLRRWVKRGAAIMVCGSRQGMGEGVHQALVNVLGLTLLNELDAAGRYRRDLY